MNMNFSIVVNAVCLGFNLGFAFWSPIWPVQLLAAAWCAFALWVCFRAANETD